VATVAALAACASGTPGTASGGDDNNGRTITIGTGFPPGTLDPTTGTQGSDLGYLNFVFDTLVQLNPQTGAIEPMLATSWKYLSGDHLQLAVFLRHGVEFQDGTPFNAQAVVDYSKAFIKAGDIANLLQFVTSVTAVGDYEVIYHLSQQNAQLLDGLAGRAGMIPSPTAVIAKSPNPNAAKLLAEFMLSDTAQKLFPQSGGYAARTDIEAPANSPALKDIKVLPVDYDYIEKETARIKRRFNEIFQ